MLTGRAITWSSGNTGVATVAPNGTVTAVAPGSATITATSEGKTGTATVTVTRRPRRDRDRRADDGQPNDWRDATDHGDAARRSGQRAHRSGDHVADREHQRGDGDAGGSHHSGRCREHDGDGDERGEGRYGDGHGGAAAVGSVTVTPATASVNVAFTTTLVATVRDVNGAVDQRRAGDVVDRQAADRRGVADGCGDRAVPGTATITASSGGKSGTAAVTCARAGGDGDGNAVIVEPS